MTRKYLAFDIETAKITPDGEEIQDHRPLGICCWAVAWIDERANAIRDMRGYGTYHDGSYAPKMTRSQCCLLVARLHRAVQQGFTILAHNGAGFDFDILAEESGMVDTCTELAMNSVDACLQVHCMRGYPVGLDAIAKGMGLQGKTEGMDGSMAPKMWAEGRFDEVLNYVSQDVCTTLQVALAIEQHQRLTWVSKTGKLNNLRVNQLLTVTEALQLPEPNTSWMSEPMPRSRFTGWMEAARQSA